MSNRSTPTVSPTSSFSQPRRLNVDHAARQRSYLDERRRQKAMYPQSLMMGGPGGAGSGESSPLYGNSPNNSSSNIMMGSNNTGMLDTSMIDNSFRSLSGSQRSLSQSHRSRSYGNSSKRSSTTNFFDEPSENSDSHHDPLHITAMGIDPTNKKATATSMSRKFFLTPPERLSVDQSVNLMDVETGQYDLPTGSDSDYNNSMNRRRSSRQRQSANNNNTGGGIFSSFMASVSQAPTPPPPRRTSYNNNNNNNATTSTGNSLTQFFTKSFSPAASTTTPTTGTTTDNSSSSHNKEDEFDPERPPLPRHNSMTSIKLNNVSEASKHSAMYGHPQQQQQHHDNNNLSLQITSHSQRKASHRSFVEAFLDEELGNSSSSGGSSRSGGSGGAKRRRKRRNKKKNATAASGTRTSNKIEFPDGYDPNEWERLAMDAKSQPLLLPPTDVDTVTHSNKNGKKRNKKKGWGKSRRSANTRSGQGNRPRRRLRVGRLALVLGVLFLIILIVLIVLIATGETLWYKFHPASSSTADTPPPHIIERNHSYLDINALPTSTQFLLLQAANSPNSYKSPQQRAWEWLEQDPKTTVGDSSTSTEFIRNSTSTEGAASVIPLDSQGTSTLASVDPLDSLAALQKFVLTTLYYATEGPDQWKDPPPHWMDINYNECDWFGLEATYYGDYSVCNRYHQLHAILLHGHGLQGRLPTEELLLISNLKHLDLGNNSLTGIVPGVWFQGWKNLEYLDVQGNSLEGQLPSELGLLSNSNGLRELNFRSNQFTGTIPTELGGLINHLDVLQLSDNRLTGTIPTELGGLVPTTTTTRGRFLLGEDNNLEYSEYYHHKALERLSLQGNDLTGRIPSQLGSLTLLTELELHHLKLDTQDMPQEICDLPLLTRLTVDCDAVTCPANCGCTCVDPLVPAPSSVSGGWVAADSGADLHVAAKQASAASRPKIHSVSDLHPSSSAEKTEAEVPATSESKTSGHHPHNSIHKVTKADPEESTTKEEEEGAESETRTVHRPTNHFVHKIPTAEAEQDKKEFDSESRTVHRPTNHFVHKTTPKAQPEEGDVEAENESRTVAAPNLFVHDHGGKGVGQTEDKTKTVTRPHHYVHPVAAKDTSLPEAAEEGDPEPPQLKTTTPEKKKKPLTVHMITNNNDMAPSPAQGKLDLPAGDFIHAEGVTIQKRPSQPKKETFENAKVTIKHRPSNRRFLRPNRDSL